MIIEQQIESDLRALASESRKKHTLVKEAAERALTVLRQQPAQKTLAILDALQLVKVSGNIKLVSVGVNLLHKVVLSGPIDAQQVLSYLTVAADMGDEGLQLRTLQTLMILLNPNTVELSTAFIDQSLSICTALFRTKTATIRNTASASLRHLVSLTFAKLQGTDKTAAGLQSGLRLFQSIVDLASGKDAQMRQESVDLIILAITGSDGWLRDLPQVHPALEHVATSLLPGLIGESSEQVLCQKAIQCAEELMEHADLGFILLPQLFALAEASTSPDWQRTAIIERVSVLCSSPPACQRLHRFQQGGMFTSLVECLGKVCSQCLQLSDKRKVKFVDEIVRLVSEAVTHLVESLMSLVEKAGIMLGEPVKVAPAVAEQETVEGLVGLIWRPLLPILTGILSSSLNETVLQTVLNCYQSVINISGTLEIAEAREGFLTSLARFCVPQADIYLSPQQVHACKTLFNIAHCLGSILDVKTWHKLLDTLHILERGLAVSRARADDSEMTSDIQILSSALDTLFSNSVLLSDATLLNLLTALGQLTLEYMETFASSEKKNKDGNTFGLEKMMIVATKNLSRSTLYWDIVSPHLNFICNSKYSEMRQLGVSSLTKLLIDVFKYMSENPPTDKTDKDKWVHWQQTLFLSLNDLAASIFEDTQVAVFEAIFEVLQTCGGQLNRTGWGMLLLILSHVRMESQSAAGFKCLSLIVSDFLLSDQLAPSLKRVVECTSKFAHDPADITAAVSAVGMFWNISDALARLGKDEEDLWWAILEDLKSLGTDSRVEVRTTSTNTLHVLLSTHGGCLSAATWQKIMKDIIFDLLETLAVCPPKTERKSLPASNEYKGDKIIIHHSRDSVEKQWEETYNIYIQNIGKLLAIYLAHTAFNPAQPSATAIDTWNALLIHLQRSMREGSDMMMQSVLKSVKEMLSCDLVQRLFFLYWHSSWELFTMMTERLRCFEPSHKLVNIILEDLDLIFGIGEEAALQREPCRELLMLLSCLLDSLKKESRGSSKLMPEEREVFEVVERLPGYFKDSETCQQLILGFVIEQITFNALDPHSEAYCRRGFKLIEQTSGKSPHLITSNIKSVLGRYKAITNLRFENEAITVLIGSSKDSRPLWCIAGESLLRTLLSIVGFDSIWTEMVSVLEALLTPSDSLLTQLSRSNLEEVVKTGEPLDIQIATFIKDTLIPLSLERDTDLQIRLLTLLDQGCSNYYRSFHDSSLQDSLSTACLRFLFDLAKVEDPRDAQSLRISKRASPVLVGRCKDFLRRFINEEKQSGMMPLPRARLLELMEILQCLKDLNVPEGTLERPGCKAHLLDLFPQLCELITSRETEVKELLKQIFLEVARTIDSSLA